MYVALYVTPLQILYSLFSNILLVSQYLNISYLYILTYETPLLIHMPIIDFVSVAADWFPTRILLFLASRFGNLLLPLFTLPRLFYR